MKTKSYTRKSFLITICFIVCGIILILSGCITSKQNLYNYGLDMTSLMQRMLEDPIYAQMVDADESQLQKYIANDYDTPLNVYKISIPTNKQLIDYLITNNPENINSPYLSLSDEMKQQIEYNCDINTLIFSLGNSSSITYTTNTKRASWTDLYQTDTIRTNYIGIKYFNGQINEKTAFLYTFETGIPIIVIFENYNNTILAKSFFMLNEKFSTLSGTREVFKVLNCIVELYKSK